MTTHDREILRDTLDLLVLQTLSGGPAHGWAIARHLVQGSDRTLRVSPGSLYPALHRLEHRGWIASAWQRSAANRRAKIYRLTATGRRRLAREAAGWRRLVHAVDLILGAR
jgi:transcriptional regulator